LERVSKERTQSRKKPKESEKFFEIPEHLKGINHLHSLIKIEELMPVEIHVTHQQVSTSISTCFVTYAETTVPVVENPRTSRNILCMVKKKH
jgi:hypothetical protein